jgi:hypothetical protein
MTRIVWESLTRQESVSLAVRRVRHGNGLVSYRPSLVVKHGGGSYNVHSEAPGFGYLHFADAVRCGLAELMPTILL